METWVCIDHLNFLNFLIFLQWCLTSDRGATEQTHGLMLLLYQLKHCPMCSELYIIYHVSSCLFLGHSWH